MLKSRWLLALPLVLAATLSTARAATIRDNAGLFDPDTVRQAEAKLEKIERTTQLPITIETVASLQGQSIDEVSLRHAQQSGTQGIFTLIAKQEKKIEVRASKAFRQAFPDSRLLAIRNAFIQGFKRNDFNAGLILGVQTLEEEVAAAKAQNGGVLRQAAPIAGGGGAPFRGRPAPARGGTFGLGSLLGIGLAIIAVLFVLRLLGNLFSGGARGYAGPSRMGGPGYGAPGYGGGGGGGGGFMSSMFGGIGGALAGNWLYDQFSGRHHQSGGTVDSSSYGAGNQGISGADTGGDDWGGGGGVSGDWGGDGGGDWGGGGAGGDWGGGGGDGGGGGGGDW